DRELEGAGAGWTRIEVDRDGVGFDRAIAARQSSDNRRRALPTVDADPDRVAIVDDTNRRLLARRRALVGELLHERVHRHRRPPRWVIELAVELRRRGHAHRG